MKIKSQLQEEIDFQNFKRLARDVDAFQDESDPEEEEAIERLRESEILSIGNNIEAELLRRISLEIASDEGPCPECNTALIGESIRESIREELTLYMSDDIFDEYNGYLLDKVKLIPSNNFMTTYYRLYLDKVDEDSGTVDMMPEEN